MTTTPKVAVLFSGHPRNVKRTIHILIKNLILPNNADVFFHTWFKSGMVCDGVDKERNAKIKIEDDTIDFLISQLQPKVYNVEEPKTFTNKNVHVVDSYLQKVVSMNKHLTKSESEAHYINQTYSMFYSIFEVNRLKEDYCRVNNVTYDIVVRCRFDANPTYPLKLSVVPNTIYYHNLNQPDNLISDWFNFGTTEVMNIYASTYLFIEYLNQLKHIPNRDANRLYPDATYTWGNEHFIRDLLDFYKVSRACTNFGIILIY